MSKQNEAVFTRVSKPARKFINTRLKKFGSIRKYLLHLLSKDGYELTQDDL